MPNITYLTINDLAEAADSQMLDTNEIEIAVDNTAEFKPFKVTFGRFANYVFEKYKLQLGGLNQTIKAALDNVISLVDVLKINIADATHNNNFTLASAICAGFVTGQSKKIYFLIPYPIVGGAVQCTDLSIAARVGSGYAYARSYDGNTYTALTTPSDANRIWVNGDSVRANEVVSVTCTAIPKVGIRVAVEFNYPLAKAAGDPSAITNNSPVGITIGGSFNIT